MGHFVILEFLVSMQSVIKCNNVIFALSGVFICRNKALTLPKVLMLKIDTSTFQRLYYDLN